MNHLLSGSVYNAQLLCLIFIAIFKDGNLWTEYCKIEMETEEENMLKFRWKLMNRILLNWDGNLLTKCGLIELEN